MKKLILFQILISSYYILLGQQLSPVINDSINKIFNNNPQNNFERIYYYKQKFKSSIAEDTLLIIAELNINNNKGECSFALNYFENDFCSRSIVGEYSGKDAIELFHIDKVYEKYKYKSSLGFVRLIEKFPIFNNDILLELEKSRFIGIKGEFYEYISMTKQFFIRNDFREIKMISKLFTKLGIEYTEEVFSVISNKQSLLKTPIDYEKCIKSYIKYSNKSTSHSIKKNTQLPDSIFNEIKMLVKRNNSKKLILLDFFYQACLPCIKSIPYLNEISKDINSEIQVVGIDPVLRDTLNNDNFMKRYMINYDVITGKNAESLTKYFNVSVFPTSILIDETGRVLLKKQGFNEGELKMLQKRN